MPRSMISISPQLTRVEAKLQGEWVRRFERNIWKGSISCKEQFVTLVVVQLAGQLLWAKSLPSREKSIDLALDLFPISQTEPHFRFYFSAGTGAFIHNVTARLVDRDHRPSILAPIEFETGLLVPFAKVRPQMDFSFACLSKGDVVVRRRYVWGLKPQFLTELESPWLEILPKGRSGVVALKTVA
jgi:hypothetical protein